MSEFIEAAKLVHEGVHLYCCMALDAASGEIFNSDARRRFSRAAKECADASCVPFGSFGYWNKLRKPRLQEIRVLALLFAHEFARTGDL